jgi:very-short-patch-repair endonuclease
LNDEPYVGFVNDLIQILAQSDMAAILANFGRRTQREDPMVHFYETFLAAYDPDLRERRGVHYTPNPIVSFIVRSVDALLKSHFGLPDGLADTTRLPDGTHKVLTLDPATGTATFLYAVIDLIREDFMLQGNAGMWSGYVKDHLLERIFGFELLMAPYAVAHFKLALQLAGHDLPEAQQAEWAYDFDSDGRLQIYLTNALEKAVEEPPRLIGPTQIVAKEAQAADQVKQETPIMVIVGNPPYAVSSANKSDYIEDLMDRYKEAVRDERNIQPLSDDYIKFIRFAHDRVERTGYGIIGFITSHSYLFGLIHRGMREELLKTFDEIYVLNLHGNARMGETTPDGGLDENVFDIQQGVAITLMIKTGESQGPATVYYADLWGRRESKYHVLNDNDVQMLDWETLQPVGPYYFFVPKDFRLQDEYKSGCKIDDIFPVNSLGIEFGSKSHLLRVDHADLEQFVASVLLNPSVTDAKIARQYGLRTTSGWRFERLRQAEIKRGYEPKGIVRCLESPFNTQYTYYAPLLRRPQREILHNMLLANIALLTARQSRSSETGMYFVAKHVYSKDAVSIRDRATGFPLYLYPEEDAATLFDDTATSPWEPDPDHGNRVPNLSKAFVDALEAKLGLKFRAFQPHPRTPSPSLGRGAAGAHNSPSPPAGRGTEGGVAQWQTEPDLWAKLKPRARKMRKEPTPAEDALWQRLRNHQLRDTKFRRQHVIGPFIVDFYARKPRLIVEVDGPIHEVQREADAGRQEHLEDLGYCVLRFTNERVLHEMETVLDEIGAALQAQQETFTPEDVLAYIYALFHSPTYRERYAEFLKIDFPRVPLTSDVDLFWRLVELGDELIQLHLMEHPQLRDTFTSFPVKGSNRVKPRGGFPKFVPEGESRTQSGEEAQRNRVYINLEQYFAGVPEEVWEFEVGGYQVLHKWLKDRKGRVLDFDDLRHYQRIVVALQQTLRLMEEIDEAIPSWPVA